MALSYGVWPVLCQNLDMVRLSQTWQRLSSSILPPCGVSDLANLGIQRYQVAHDSAEAYQIAARGRWLWLAGRCDDALAAWVTAANKGYSPTAVYLLLSNHWSEIPHSTRAEASQYAQEMGFRKAEQALIEEATNWYQLAWQLSPSIQTAQWLADYHLSRGHRDEAIAIWRQIQAVLPTDDSEHWLSSGKAAALQEDWLLAAQMYGEAARRSLQPSALLVLQAQAYEKANSIDEALAAYESAVMANPTDPDSYVALISLANERGDAITAEQWQLRAIAAFKGSENELNLGYAYIKRGNLHAARPYIEQWHSRHANDFWSSYLWSQVLYADGEQELAIAELNGAIGRHPGRPLQWQRQLGDWYLAIGRLDAARVAYQTAIEWETSAKEVQNPLGPRK